ncbi:MAG: guanylate kinase [Candidatus Omnitrophica bacterium]|nr:guanylate kinase [Candidatus Omnitrophota bacterium]
MKKSKGRLFIVSGPSGSGKTTLCKMLMALDDMRPRLAQSVSFTTRPIRLGEVDGRDYFFVSEDIFARYKNKKWMLEWKNVLGYNYGTQLKYVKDTIKKGKDMLLCVDVGGARQLKKSRFKKGAVTIFIMPPNLKTLEERLRLRSTDSERAICARLKLAKQEIKSVKEYNYIIINNDIDWAIEELKSIILAEHCRREHALHSIRKINR